MASLFSVVIPAYNHAAYIARALDSVLEQTCPDWEVIVIDDASSDDTWTRIEQHPIAVDPRCRRLRHTHNHGAHATLNEGIVLAQGKWVAILNSDDFFTAERLDTAHTTFTREPELVAVFSDYAYVDADGNEVESASALAATFPNPSEALGEATSLLSQQEIEVLALLARNYWHTTSNLICRRSALNALSGFADWRYVHDYDLFLRLATTYPVQRLPRHLLNYRFHGSNTISENAIHSVGETAAMVATFLATRPLAPLRDVGPATLPVLSYLYQHCRLYGGERLALLLAELPASAIPPLWQRWQADPAVFAKLAVQLEQTIAQDRQQQNHNWQEEQTRQWWKRAMAAEDRISQVQKELITCRQEYGAKLRQSHENEAWQRTQTDQWWQHAVKLQAELAHYRRIHACVRWLGIPCLWHNLRRLLSRPKA